MQDLNHLQKALEDYIMKPDESANALDLAVKYEKCGMSAAAIGNYMVGIECDDCPPEIRHAALIQMAWLYFKQGDRLSEVRLMADYAKSLDPTDIRVYAVKCAALERKALDNDSTTDRGFRLELWLGLLNEALTAINMPKREHNDKEEYYMRKEYFVFWYGEALLHIGLRDEAYEQLNSIVSGGCERENPVWIKAIRLLYNNNLQIDIFKD